MQEFLVFTAFVFWFLAGAIGYFIGREGFIEKTYWTKCVFEGKPPSPYKSWQHFVASKVKHGVTISATKQ